MPQAIC